MVDDLIQFRSTGKAVVGSDGSVIKSLSAASQLYQFSTGPSAEDWGFLVDGC